METQPLVPAAVLPCVPRPSYDGPVTWADVCADPLLQNLPFKIELDRYGRILMSPVATRHSRLQGRIARLLEAQLGGEAFPECAIRTADGTRVPDVVWMSDAFASTLQPDTEAMLVAPEICVEVRSRSNVWAEMEEKTRIFLAAGAREVWICEVDGRMRFFDAAGERSASALAPGFPAIVPLPGGAQPPAAASL